MSVIILNVTGNRDGFEDDFCKELSSKITATKQIDIIERRGLNLWNVNIQDSDIVVIVGHGGREDFDSTLIDFGLADEILDDVEFPDGFDIEGTINMLDDPLLLRQMIGRNNRRYVVFLCVCEGLAPNTIFTSLDDPNCVGTIESREKIDVGRQDQFDAIVAIINQVHYLLEAGVDDHNKYQNTVREITKKCEVDPDFWFMTPPTHSFEEMYDIVIDEAQGVIYPAEDEESGS